MVRKTHASKKKIKLIQERGPLCARCHTLYEDSDSFTIDHIIPRNVGFKQSYYVKSNNLQLLCYDCQRTKNALEQSFRNHWMNSRKNLYVLLLNGFANPLQAVMETTMNS